MHGLITGPTGCGKSVLSKILISRLLAKGKQVVVFDPMEEEWPKGCRVFRTGENMTIILQKQMNQFVFVDESSELLAGRDSGYEWLATQSRHYGHLCHFILQHPTQVLPIIRGQCSTIWMFRLSERYGKLMADEFGCQQLKQSNQLKISPERGFSELLYANKTGNVKQYVLFYKNDKFFIREQKHGNMVK